MDQEFIRRYLAKCAAIMTENKDKLLALDSVVGDGDLGLTMSDGFKAAHESVIADKEGDIGKMLFKAGKAMAAAVPSTMGTLMAAGLMSSGKALKGKENLTLADIAVLFTSYEEGVQKLGKAQVGEKTFLDGLHPAAASLAASAKEGTEAGVSFQKALTEAEKGYQAAAKLEARHGRAATRGAQSIGLEDPGAYVAVLLMEALVETSV